MYIYFPFWWNSLGPMWHDTGCCLVKFSTGSTVMLGTDDTTFTLCSVRPHDFYKLNCITWLLRRCTYVLFTPPQLSWQPNPFVMLRRFVRKAPLLLFRFQLRCYEKLFSNQNSRAFNFALLGLITMSVRSRTVGKEEGLVTYRAKHVVSCISVK